MDTRRRESRASIVVSPTPPMCFNEGSRRLRQFIHGVPVVCVYSIAGRVMTWNALEFCHIFLAGVA